MEVASSKCCTDSPEGPAEVPFGKDFRMRRMSKEGLRVTGSEDDTGDRRTGQEGFLSCNKCNVVSVIGAVPLDKKIWQALPSNSAWPRETAEETVRLVLLDVRWPFVELRSLALFFCHCPEGDQVIVKPKLAERLNRCVEVGDSFVFKRREDTL